MKALLYDWGGFNAWLFHVINGTHSDWLDQIMLLGTALAEHAHFPLYMALLACAAVLAHRDQAPQRTGAWLIVLAVFALGNLADGWVVGVLKELFAFPRPPLALGAGNVVLVGNPEINLQHSLPSGHASFAMLLASSLWPVLGRSGRYAACAFVAWVCLSRVSLGAHFPADVVAGALSCLLVVIVLRSLLSRLRLLHIRTSS